MFRWVSLMGLLSLAAFAQESRHVTFHYAFAVKNIAPGRAVRVWIPAAHSDLWQEVRIVSATGDLPVKRNRESKSGNEMYYAEAAKSEKSELHFEVVYDVVRHQRIVLGRAIPHLADVPLDKKQRKEFLLPDRLVPISDPPADAAAQVTQAKSTQLEKARAIYDYVLATLVYDDTSGGSGDALRALQTKRGDCTEFHSLFIAMARSQGIPARFEIGFPLPAGQGGEISGYDCWADFFDPKNGWVPVDISAGARRPEKRDFFFGAQDADRVAFTTGRDLLLNPRQAGDALNYFVNPYVEVDGKAYSNFSTAFSFAENTSAAAGK